jgi:predicted dienelactone hydrolase
MNVKTRLQGDFMFKPLRLASLVGVCLLLVVSLSIYSQLELPAPGGPYEVGRMVVKWVDSTRPEVLTEDPQDAREVIAMVWYPAETGMGENAAYFPHLPVVADSLVQSGEVTRWQVWGLQFVRSEVLLDATPIKAEHPFPVVIFSPGNGTNIEFYTSLAGEIASQGYIVLGLNHPYDVPAVELSSGKIARYDKEQWTLSQEENQQYIAERIKVRVTDVIHVLEQLEEMNETGPFAGVLDLDSVAVAGHSLGGITASEACKVYSRVKACLNFDGLQQGGPFSMDESAVPPAQPFFFLTKEPQLHPKLVERFESMTESYWVVVHGATHQSFTDGPLLQPSLFPVPNRADEWMGLIQQYSIAFLNHVLKGQPDDLLYNTTDKMDVSVKVFRRN